MKVPTFIFQGFKEEIIVLKLLKFTYLIFYAQVEFLIVRSLQTRYGR